MNASVKKQWVDALRSGEYKQGIHTLRRQCEGQDQFCCLGVLCDLYSKAFPTAAGKWNHGITVGDMVPFVRLDSNGEEEAELECLPPAVREWAGLETGDPILSFADDRFCVSTLNDDERLDFNAIAHLIEEQL